MTIVTIWVICALFGDWLVPYDPLNFRGDLNGSPSWSHPFGTDKGGRDVLSRVIAGARDVLKIAPLAAILGVIGGVILGMFMGYLRGWFDTIASRIVESFLVAAGGLLGLLAVTTLGNSNWVVIGVVATLFTPVVARTVRSAVLAETRTRLRRVGQTAGRIDPVHHVPRDPAERVGSDRRRADRSYRLRRVHGRDPVVPRCRPAAALARLGIPGQ